MSTPKLTAMTSIISQKLSDKNVPFCVIGALALGLYGLPRYTADIDLLADHEKWDDILGCLTEAGYTCWHKTGSFAQFESDLNVFGRVDILLVTTQDGQDMINRSVLVQDPLMGRIPVIQSSDYLVLKLMAIANDPSRRIHDEADIAEFMKLRSNFSINPCFDPLDMDRILSFADRFGQRALMEVHLNSAVSTPIEKGKFNL